MFSNIKSENSLGNLCGYVTIRFCIFASFNDMLLFLSYINIWSPRCVERRWRRKRDGWAVLAVLPENMNLSCFLKLTYQVGGSASTGGSTALPCTLCMNGVECWHVKCCLMEPSVYNKPGPAALRGRWCKLTEVKDTVRQDYSRDIKSGF